MSTDFTSWIRPLTIDDFIGNTWRRAPLVVDSSPGLAELERVAGSLTLEHLLTQAEQDTRVWYVDGEVADYSLDAPIAMAHRLYRAGLTLYFNLRQEGCWAALADSFASHLGWPRERVRVSAFATRAGKRTLLHVDGNENFTLQLSGRKRWRVSDDPHARVPLEQWRADAPEAAHPLQTIELVSGSMIYLPGSWRHEVDSIEDSLSLNVALVPLSWADAVTPMLAQLLVRDPRWAEPAVGLSDGSPTQRAIARERVHALLRSLASSIDEHTTALVSALADEAPQGRFIRRNPLAEASVVRGPQPDREPRLQIVSGETVSTMELGLRDLAVAKWLVTQPADVSVDEFLAAARRLGSEDGLTLLDALLESALVKRSVSPSSC